MAIDYLGGTCAECGAVEELEIDHVDRSTKSINISKLILAKDEKLFVELAKCQLLCEEHHDAKTSREMGVPHGGGAKGKRGCCCEPCREAVRKYNREFSATKRKSKPV
jgi:5-methylcytosine-specific restriction endonuclease McrA